MCKGLSKHENGLSKHEKGLSEHEKGLSVQEIKPTSYSRNENDKYMNF